MIFQQPQLLYWTQHHPWRRQVQQLQQVHRFSKISAKYPPSSCHDLFTLRAQDKQKVVGSQHRTPSFVVHDPNEGMVHARRTITKPHFWISLHHQAFDGTRWAIMEYGFYYERQQSNAFVQILQQQAQQQAQDKGGEELSVSSVSSPQQLAPPPLHVIDVGGNIGWYSLLSVAAATAVHRSIKVDVFEPNPRNRYRLCESLQMNQWMDHELVDVSIYPLGVSASSGGMMPMSITDAGVGKLGRIALNATENINIPLVTLDHMSQELGWEEEEEAVISILKVDVEGLELEVLLGAKRLLQSGRIHNIFFEGNARNGLEARKFQAIITLLVQSGFDAYKFGSWLGPNKNILTHPLQKVHRTKPEFILSYTEGVMAECSSNNAGAGRKPENEQCNMWWKKSPDNEKEEEGKEEVKEAAQEE
jgi:FkbM family methyltransferase